MLAPPNYFLHVTSTSSGKNAWDASITYQLSNPLTVDKTYVITFKGKINVQAWTSKDPVQLYFWPSCEKGTQYLPGFQLTKNWDQVSLEFKASQPIEKLNFEFGFLTGDFCIDDISLVEKGTDKNLILNSDFEDDNVNSWTFPSWLKQLSIIRDKEESTNSGGEEAAKDSLNKVLDKWIGGMMTACDGKVKAFDAVNEPMSDNVPTELKTGTAGRDGSTKTNFFWQDYLGKDYARTVVALARKYGPSDLKLFINDYNLEAAYNKNAKCKGLIDMIKYWESDGVTKIDGIGTQMHVTCSLAPTTQKQNEDAVVNQFKLLAATGKLIKISELDMRLADKAGKLLTTDSVNTEEMQNAQKAYYNFIIKAYFDNVPVAQRYGITLWSQTDSPANSGWIPNEPIGLWNKDYVRKPAYAGFADGLAGK